MNPMKLVLRSFCVLLAITLFSTQVWSQTTAIEILTQVSEKQQAHNSIQHVQMTLTARNGTQQIRQMEVRVLTTQDSRFSYVRFSQPADVAGTQLVIIDHNDQEDEQLLYLPALKRIQLIRQHARTGPFMGSDFRFEDMNGPDVDHADHTIFSQDDLSWVIDSRPHPQSTSSYGLVRTHIRKTTYHPTTIEYFDDENNPIKVLTIEDSIVSNGITLPIVSTMTNLSRGTSTRLEVIEHRINVPQSEIPPETFTRSYMRRNG